MIKNLESKLAGLESVSKEDLIELVNSWGRKNSFSIGETLIKISKPIECYDLSKLDVSKIEDLSSVFRYSNFNGNLSEWNVGNCRNMAAMFANSEFNNNSIRYWDTKYVKNMSFMFSNTNFNHKLDFWNTESLIKMQSMFAYGKYNHDISIWDFDMLMKTNRIYKENPLHQMFEGNVDFQKSFNNNKPFPKETNDILDWIDNRKRILSKTLTEEQILKEKLEGKRPIKTTDELIELVSSWGRKDAFYTEQGKYIRTCQPKECYDLSKLDVSLLKELPMIFYGSNFNGDISKWNISSCTNMDRMFAYSKFNNNSISNWNVSNVKNMEAMFFDSKFNQDISKWKVFNCINFNSMFENSNFDGNIFKWDFNKNTNTKNIVLNNIDFMNKYNNGQHIDQSKKDSFVKFVKNHNIKEKEINGTMAKMEDNKNTLDSFLKEKGINKDSDLGKQLIEVYNEKQNKLKQDLENIENLKKEVSKLAELDFFDK